MAKTYRSSKPLDKTPAFGGPGNGFRSSFADAKKAGKKNFTWNGKKYTTTTAAEKAKNMSYSELEKSHNKATNNHGVALGVEGKPKSKSAQKSTKEIKNSYGKRLKAVRKNKGWKLG